MQASILASTAFLASANFEPQPLGTLSLECSSGTPSPSMASTPPQKPQPGPPVSLQLKSQVCPPLGFSHCQLFLSISLSTSVYGLSPPSDLPLAEASLHFYAPHLSLTWCRYQSHSLSSSLGYPENPLQQIYGSPCLCSGQGQTAASALEAGFHSPLLLLHLVTDPLLPLQLGLGATQHLLPGFLLCNLFAPVVLSLSTNCNRLLLVSSLIWL